MVQLVLDREKGNETVWARSRTELSPVIKMRRQALLLLSFSPAVTQF